MSSLDDDSLVEDVGKHRQTKDDIQIQEWNNISRMNMNLQTIEAFVQEQAQRIVSKNTTVQTARQGAKKIQ